MTSDGAPGIIKQRSKFCFPRAACQRCLACIACVKLGGQTAGGCLAGVQGSRAGVFIKRQAEPLQREPRGRGRCIRLWPQVRHCGLPASWTTSKLCIAHLRFPVTHRRGTIRTTNLLERLFVEERRRPQDYPQRLRRASRPEADVWRADPRRRAMAFGQSHRVRTSPVDFCQKRTRSGIRDAMKSASIQRPSKDTSPVKISSSS